MTFMLLYIMPIIIEHNHYYYYYYITLAFNPWKIHGGHMQRPWMETEGWRQEVVGNEQR